MAHWPGLNYRPAMNLKLILVLITTAHLAVAALRRTPRVYNALITTDQNLTPSRSYPVIQPHIEYPAIPFGAPLDPTWLNPYNPYYASGIYSPQAAHSPAYFGSDYPHPQLGIGPQLSFSGSPHFVEHGDENRKTDTEASGDGVEDIDENSTASGEQDEGKASDGRGDQASNGAEQSRDSSDEQQQDEHDLNSDNNQNTKQNRPNNRNQAPLPLNQFGLPPHLVPINPPYNSWNLQRHDPVNLSPYPYNSYPLIYDQVPSYQPSPFLPPYGLFSPNWAGGRSPLPSFGTGNQHGNRKPDGQDKHKSSGSGKGKGSNDSKPEDQGQQDTNQQNGQGQSDEGQTKQDGNNQETNQQDQSQLGQNQKNETQQDQNQQDQNQQDQSQEGGQNQQDSEQQSSQKNEQNTSNSEQSQSSGGQNRSGSSQSQKQSKRRRAKEYPTGETDMTTNIRNFNPINRNVPDVPPPPPPSGAKDP